MSFDNSDCKKARDLIKDVFRRDMLGPGSERLCGFPEEEEVICEKQIKHRYSVGLLFPDETVNTADETIPIDTVENDGDEDEVSDQAETGYVTQTMVLDDDGDDLSQLAHEFAPSAMGISFRLMSNVTPENIHIRIKAAYYGPASHETDIKKACCVKLLCPESFVTEKYKKFLKDNKIFLDNGKLFLASHLSEDDEKRFQNNCDSFAETQCHNLEQNESFMTEFCKYQNKEKRLAEKIWSARCIEQDKWFIECQNTHKAEIEILKNLSAFLASVKKIYKQYFVGLKRHEKTWEGSLVDLKEKKELFADVAPGANLEVSCVRHDTLYSIFLANRSQGRIIFAQPEIKITADTPAILFLPDKSTPDLSEEQMLKMRYRKKKQYAKGHGCSVAWSTPIVLEHNDAETAVTEISTTFMPQQSINAMLWDITPVPGGNVDSKLLKEALKIDFLADENLDKKAEKIQALEAFVANYGQWIANLESSIENDMEIKKQYESVAHDTIVLCKEAKDRMTSGIDLLKSNPIVYRAFCLANQAIVRSRTKDNPDFPQAAIPKWRLFQLGFILLTTESLVDPNSDARNIVDLLWFPTGGGKTEAYLALTAMTIFYRQLTGNGEREIAGTAVIMRYTLRLLTSQQFIRAAALICACDRIRESENISKVPITLGLWVGGGENGIPNDLQKAKTIVNKLKDPQNVGKHPFQPTQCPWCGGNLQFRVEGKKFEISCNNTECPYSFDNLPIQIIDECLYQEPPTLLFGTVDKFAQLTFKEDAGKFFGLSGGERIHPSPALIIQDEMHLISDELGSMVGLYETAIKGLCKLHNGMYPKIVASTATVRRAGDQCKALYGCKKICQFPPSGIDSDDSYFAKEDKNTEKPGREYVAIQSSGQTASTTLIRMMASLLLRVKNLDITDEIKDIYYTLVTYFNSLRELGACETWVHADITERIKQLAKNDYLPDRHLDNVKILCSRRDAAEIPTILDELTNRHYPNQEKKPVDVLLSSNMLSVGIDVDRFGSMIVVGHPKKNAEFIQASSRVGRQTPSSGLVFCLYNGAKARDCSYFEVFPDYIQSFYKYVEPTTVTPFTKAARKKALHAVLVILMRHAITGWHANNFPQTNIIKDDFEGIKDIILEKVAIVVEKEIDYDAISAAIDGLVAQFIRAKTVNEITCYKNYGRQQGVPLLTDSESNSTTSIAEEISIPWATMNSVRSVDKMVKAKILE